VRAFALALILLTGLPTPALADGGLRRQAEALQAEAAFASSALVQDSSALSP
jgi:hypothetical protein